MCSSSGYFFCSNVLLPLLSENYYLVVSPDLRNAFDVNHDLIHAHPPEDGRAHPSDQDGSFIGQDAVIAISISNGNQGSLGGFQGDESAPITDAFPRGQLVDTTHPALQAER